MKTSERLYTLLRPLWEGYFEHPFVKGIADGTLPIEKFRFYMIQDHKYLMQYAKVFALGLIRSSEESDMRLFGQLITGTLDTENAVHQSYLSKLGITRQMIDETPMALDNESYTSYMLSIAMKGGLPEISAAVLACSWSYKLIGDHIAENYPESKSHPFYGAWVEMYSSQEYSAMNDMLIEMTDRFTANCSEIQLREIERILLVCSEYEARFWDMAWSEGVSCTQ